MIKATNYKNKFLINEFLITIVSLWVSALVLKYAVVKICDGYSW